MRVDAHQHFWRYDAAAYDWIASSMHVLRRDYLPPNLQGELEAAGFDRSIAVQARQSVQETHDLLALADAHPFIAGVIGWVDLQSPDADREIADAASHPRLLGVRHVVQSEPDGFMASPAFRRGVSGLARFDLTYDVLVYARQLAEAAALVRAFPQQRFVLDHLGKPDIRGGGFDDWRPAFADFGACPNAWCKLSGLVTEADWDTWTPAQLRPYIETALDVFGPSRLMIGSDWPVCTLAAPYATTLRLVEDAIGALTPDERAQILGGTAVQLWNL